MAVHKKADQKNGVLICCQKKAGRRKQEEEIREYGYSADEKIKDRIKLERTPKRRTDILVFFFLRKGVFAWNKTHFHMKQKEIRW